MRLFVMVTIIASVALCPISARCASRSTDNDFICVSTWETQPCPCVFIHNYAQKTIYMAILNPTRPIASFACRMRFVPSEGFFGEWTAADGWSNTAPAPALELTSADEPATGEFVVLAINTIVVIDESIENEIHIDPPDGEDTLVYLDPDGNPVPLFHCGSGADAYLNPGWGCQCIVPANTPLTWSTVKTLYR